MEVAEAGAAAQFYGDVRSISARICGFTEQKTSERPLSNEVRKGCMGRNSVSAALRPALPKAGE
jgi:hypothetical protein